MAATKMYRVGKDGEHTSLGLTHVYLAEKSLWLNVWAPAGSNVRFPDSVAIGAIKVAVAESVLWYKNKELHIYDAVQKASAVEDGSAGDAGDLEDSDWGNGGYEYLDKYVVKQKSLLYLSAKLQNVAGPSDDMDPETTEQTEQRGESEMLGITWVNVHDTGTWEK
eukprot:614438-Pyramimonas_sp.AAC.1